MRRFVVAVMLMCCIAAYASDDIQAKCDAEGGCFLITQRAYEYFVNEIVKLTNTIAKMKKEQCA